MDKEKLLQKLTELGKGNPSFDAGYVCGYNCGYSQAIKDAVEYITNGGKHNGAEK